MESWTKQVERLCARAEQARAEGRHGEALEAALEAEALYHRLRAQHVRGAIQDAKAAPAARKAAA